MKNNQHNHTRMFLYLIQVQAVQLLPIIGFVAPPLLKLHVVITVSNTGRIDLATYKEVHGVSIPWIHSSYDRLCGRCHYQTCLWHCQLFLGAHVQRRHTVVCWYFCHSVCYRDSGSTHAIQVLKHAQMGTNPCFLGFKL